MSQFPQINVDPTVGSPEIIEVSVNTTLVANKAYRVMENDLELTLPDIGNANIGDYIEVYLGGDGRVKVLATNFYGGYKKFLGPNTNEIDEEYVCRLRFMAQEIDDTLVWVHIGDFPQAVNPADKATLRIEFDPVDANDILLLDETNFETYDEIIIQVFNTSGLGKTIHIETNASQQTANRMTIVVMDPSVAVTAWFGIVEDNDCRLIEGDTIRSKVTSGVGASQPISLQFFRMTQVWVPTHSYGTWTYTTK